MLNLADGEIAGLVIGLFCAFLIVVAVITFLIILYRRKKQAREKSNEKYFLSILISHKIRI